MATGIIEELKKDAEQLKQLFDAMEKAEAAFKAAKEQYDYFRTKVFPDKFLLNGINAVECTDGTKAVVKTMTTCHVNKNEADKRRVNDWLREHDGSDLIKTVFTVDSKYLEAMKAAGIEFKQDDTVNSNSLKAWLLDQLGQRDGPAHISVDDIPKGINFFQWEEVEITK